MKLFVIALLMAVASTQVGSIDPNVKFLIPPGFSGSKAVRMKRSPSSPATTGTPPADATPPTNPG